jgi:hypothetical protein
MRVQSARIASRSESPSRARSTVTEQMTSTGIEGCPRPEGRGPRSPRPGEGPGGGPPGRRRRCPPRQSHVRTWRRRRTAALGSISPAWPRSCGCVRNSRASLPGTQINSDSDGAMHPITRRIIARQVSHGPGSRLRGRGICKALLQSPYTTPRAPGL